MIPAQPIDEEDMPPDDDGGAIAAALAALEAFGLHLPADTCLANLAERIRVAGHGKMKRAGSKKPKRKPKRTIYPGDKHPLPKEFETTDEGTRRVS